jgi:N-methylhydantoinase A/oxoprolinase/acetone carboxylase beta subunit
LRHGGADGIGDTGILDLADAGDPRQMVLCFASGPTNSTRSARMLSGLDGAIVLDVGGVSTFFRTPDVVAIALGGGTIVDQDNAIGPASVGYRISQMARVPGGDTLTLTDVAVNRGRMGFGDADRVADLAPSLSEHVEGWIEKQLADLVDRIAEEDRPFDAGAQVGWPGLHRQNDVGSR